MPSYVEAGYSDGGSYIGGVEIAGNDMSRADRVGRHLDGICTMPHTKAVRQ